MIVYYFYNFYTFDFHPNILAMFVIWNRVFMRCKNQSIRLVQIASPLSLPVIGKFMKITWQVPYFFQVIGKS